MIRTLNKGKKKLDWYVKWSASIMVLIAIIARASGPEFRDIDMVFWNDWNLSLVMGIIIMGR